MVQRYPCPNPTCEHWNPVDRKTCWACQRALSEEDVRRRRSPAAGGRRGRLPWLVGIAVAAAVVLLAWRHLGRRAALADTDAPRLVVRQPADATVHVSEPTVRVSGQVQDEHPDRVEAQGRTVAVRDGAFALDLDVPDGESTVEIVAYDVAGNASEAHALTLVADRVAPEIVTLEPSSGATVSTARALVSGTASEDLASVRANSQDGEVDGSSFRVTVPLTEGSNSILVVVADRAGNTVERAVDLTYQERRLPAGFTAGGRTSSGHELFVAAKDGASLVLVPGGSFPMGFEGGEADEKPVHEVTLSPYFMELAPVTLGRYRRFAEETGRRVPPQADPDATDEHPVVNVTWTDARDYADWAGRRLPTEAEWELAARGTAAQPYPWGQDPPTGTDRANVRGDEDGFEATSPVGHFAAGASPYGLHDMAGNVWEWVGDRYGERYYASSPAEDPPGPERGAQRCLRGGSFTSSPASARSSNRYFRAPSSGNRNVGFRTAASFPE